MVDLGNTVHRSQESRGLTMLWNPHLSNEEGQPDKGTNRCKVIRGFGSRGRERYTDKGMSDTR